MWYNTYRGNKMIYVDIDGLTPCLVDNRTGGHLFAIAARRSCDYGFGGAISGFAANKDLMIHYINAFDAEPICMLHEYQIFIPEESGKKIQEVYSYEWTDDII